MDKESYRKQFIEELMKLKEKYNLPDMETDKVILDFDNIGQYIDDEKALKAYSGQLLDMTEYRANAGVSPNPYEGEPFESPVPDESVKTPIDEEFKGIVDNEVTTRWWRYDNSYSDEAKDYMERYTTGDLTDEEMQELIDEDKANKDIDNKIADAKSRYDAEVAETAGQLGITDTKAFKTLVQVGAKLLNAIDEELIYSPLLLAEKGLKALGLTVPGKAIGGLGRAAMAYEGYLFQAQLGLAALSQSATAMAGGASRLPGEIANGILNLYGAGMPEGLAPDVETGISKEEQAKRQEMMFYNQMYQYSRLSPSLRLFTDVVGPKTGISDPIQGYKTGFDRFSKMLGGDK